MSDTHSAFNPGRLKKLLRRLVDIYSPSGKEEEILHFLNSYLKRNGLSVQCQPVDEKRYNLVVLPSEQDIHLALVGHLDTVAAYDLNDYGYVEQADQIRGLGTADMKGGCAAMVEAYMTLHQSNHSWMPVALCLVVGEEEEGDGAKRLVEDYRIPWAIVGEPTDLRPCLSNYGYVEVQISTFGKRLHASLANTTENPIQGMLRLMLRIFRYMEEQQPELVYNIRDLFSAQSGFAVPEHCEAWLDVHLPPGSPIGTVATELEELVLRENEDNAFLDAELRIVTIEGGYELPEKGHIIDAIKALYTGRALPWEPQPFRSHSDANRLWAAGVKTILLGPGKLEMAHVPEESVSFQQICLATELYLDLLMKL